MINFIKSLFGFGGKETPVVETPAPVAETKEAVKAEPAPKAVKATTPAKKTTKKAATKKAATKKAATVDLDSMSKKDLLAHAKANGIKSNASMSKAAILEAIKNA
jgi:hypothetical protein